MTRSDRRYTWPRRQTAFWGKRLYIQAEIYVRQSAAGTACRKHRQRPQTGRRSAAPPGGGLIRRYRRYSGRSRSRAASACQAEILHAPAGSWSLASLRFVLFEQEYTICNISLAYAAFLSDRPRSLLSRRVRGSEGQGYACPPQRPLRAQDLHRPPDHRPPDRPREKGHHKREW